MKNIKYIALVSMFAYSLVFSAARTGQASVPPAAGVATETKETTSLAVEDFDPQANKLVWEALTQSSINLPHVKSLLASGKANPNQRSGAGLTPLGHAVLNIKNKDLSNAVVKLFLSHGADPLMTTSANTRTLPIHEASRQLNERLVTTLLSKNPEGQVNAQEEFGRTPADFALFEIQRHPAVKNILDILISRGALQDTYGIIASALGEEDKFKLLDNGQEIGFFDPPFLNRKRQLVLFLREKLAERQKATKEALHKTPEIAGLPPGLEGIISSYTS